jgi:NAD(P)-dependent dehydrogenase (short-subunit alcohol dehydrogenase family)
MPEGGSILNMSSNHAFSTMPGLFPYNAVKAGIDGMTRALALELGPYGIRVNTVNPGWIEIERTKEELTADDRDRVERIHPLGRIGTPEDVAGTVSFLASDDAAFITGASILVDGGRTAVMQDHTYVDYASSIRSNGE